MNVTTFVSPIGKLFIKEEDGFITGVSFWGREQGESSETSENAARQLSEYFSGRRKTFDLPLRVTGSEFSKKVWAALTRIPYGQTLSYKQVAENIGAPKACRAVGRANNVNPIAIIIPCHRVIGSSGDLTGYAGGIDKKQFLLDLERKNLRAVMPERAEK